MLIYTMGFACNNASSYKYDLVNRLFMVLVVGEHMWVNLRVTCC
jgi:hypothetical protein